MGLTDNAPNPDLPFDQQLQQLTLIVNKADVDSQITADNIKDMSAELISLRQEEGAISSALFGLQKRYSEMLQLRKSMDQYEESLQIQMQRLEISTWLRSLTDSDGTCPFCNHAHPGISNELDALCNAISEIEKTAGDMKFVPATFEREMQVVKNDIAHYSEQLAAVRGRISSESRKRTDTANKSIPFLGFLGS